MRIIAGKYKGHKLVSFNEDHIRPMTDRVKESLFNIIAKNIPGATVLDLYSGTGSVGLEALSRGAQSIIFVENHIRSIQLIRKNVEILKVSDSIEIFKDDALKFIKEYEGDGFDMVFADPPFPSKICVLTLEALASSKALKSNAKVVIEHSSHEILPSEVGTLRFVDSRKYGDKILTFYDKGN